MHWLLAFLLLPFEDHKHFSKTFGEERNYRLLLPASYAAHPERRYPVIYYFHGHSDRYTVEKYDNGKDTVPKMAEFAAKNDAIVVSVDGYVARDYTGFYGGTPWDVRLEGGDYDFGAYFHELVAHIDSAYRTIPTRRHRATSGLSMGGFMSLWLSARYPHLIGSASSFNPGPEFYAGDKGRRVLWRPKDHTANHEHTMIRLIRASGDYISQYHEETHDAYARAAVDFEFRQDEYHRHWATSIGETFAFHMRAFANPSLGNVPEVFSHANPYRDFTVWDNAVHIEGGEPALVSLEEVRQGGLRIRTRRWAPDGPPAAVRVRVRTAALYKAGAPYEISDHSLRDGKCSRRTVTAGADGRLAFEVDGSGHQLGINGPGTGAQPPVLLPLTGKDWLAIRPDTDVTLPLRIHNPRAAAMAEVRAELTSDYPTVRVSKGRASIAKIDPGAAVDVANTIRLTSGDGELAPTRLKLRVVYDGWYSVEMPVDVLAAPSVLPAPAEVKIFDGRKETLPVFRQRGNQGGGEAVPREIAEGKGNGDGRIDPGEEVTVWVRIPQGLDPFDKNTWHRAKLRTEAPWVEEVADIQEAKQREWTGAQERTSAMRVAKGAPSDAKLLLEAESWSFHWTPDVRYGPELLYQAFQRHRRHLYEWALR